MQRSEDKRVSNRELIRFFQSRLVSLSPETANKYSRVITDIDIFLTGHHLRLTEISETMATDWAFDLLRGGLAPTTVVRHLNILNSLLNSAVKKAFLPGSVEAPRAVARKIEKGEIRLPKLLREETFAECLELLRGALRRTALRPLETYSEEATAEDVAVYSLLNGAMPLKDVVMLKKKDVAGSSEASRRIAEINIDPRRAFVFNLRQSFNTPKQILSRLSSTLNDRYGRFAETGQKFDAESLVRAIWVACAVRGGATYSEAAGMLMSQTLRPGPGAISPTGEQGWIKTVNSLIAHDMPRWYAMHLRKGVSYSDLLKEIGENVRPVPELFYPSETIRKRVGGKFVMADKPFISSTLFFKTFPDQILPMFSRIGDKAWCYRVSREAGAPYAVISGEDMRRFQAVIGVFTPDTEVHPMGGLTPRPGEPVVIIKAGYGNRRGEIEDVIGEGSGSMIFRVKLSTDQGYEWRLDLSPQQIQRIGL